MRQDERSQLDGQINRLRVLRRVPQDGEASVTNGESIMTKPRDSNDTMVDEQDEVTSGSGRNRGGAADSASSNKDRGSDGSGKSSTKRDEPESRGKQGSGSRGGASGASKQSGRDSGNSGSSSGSGRSDR